MLGNLNRILAHGTQDCDLPWNDWTLEQKKTVAAISRVSSSLSIIGSSVIILHIIRNPCENARQQQFKSIYHRLMIGLSVSDLVGSFGIFLSTWPKPSENEYTAFDYEAYGTTGTCDAQGFTILFGYLSSTVYYSGLTLYFLLCIKYGWSSIKLHRMENLCHLVSCPVALMMSLICQLNHAFNPSGRFCFVQSYPINCELLDDVECQRGSNVMHIHKLLMGLVFVGFIVILYSMMSLYLFVRAQQVRVAAYTHSSSSEKKERKVFNIACWYVTVYSIAYVPPIVQMIISSQDSSACHKTIFGVSIIASIFTSIQGMMNAIVFLQFRPIKWLMPSMIFPRSFSFTEVPSILARRLSRSSRKGSINGVQSMAAAAEAVRKELMLEIDEETAHDDIPENSELRVLSLPLTVTPDNGGAQEIVDCPERCSHSQLYDDVEENSSQKVRNELDAPASDEDVVILDRDVSNGEVIKSA